MIAEVGRASTGSTSSTGSSGAGSAASSGALLAGAGGFSEAPLACTLTATPASSALAALR